MAANEEVLANPFVQMTDDDVLSALLDSPMKPAGAFTPAQSIAAPVVAELVAFDLGDKPIIRYRDALQGEQVVARSILSLQRSQLGSDVVVLCEAADPRRPIILGVVQQSAGESVAANKASAPVTVQADGQRYVLNAEREIVLRCGAASITLTRAGKVIIKGTYVLSRSSGYNKIKGAAVDIN